MREQSGATWLNNIVMEEVKMLVCLCAGFFLMCGALPRILSIQQRVLRILSIVWKYPFWLKEKTMEISGISPGRIDEIRSDGSTSHCQSEAVIFNCLRVVTRPRLS